MLAPCGPGDQEVEARAEAGLDDHECLARLPSVRQPVSAKKHMLGFGNGALGRGVDIAISGGIQGAVLQPGGLGGDYRRGLWQLRRELSGIT